MKLPRRRRSERPRINGIAGPIFGELFLGIGVAMAGLWLASETSDAAAGAFAMSAQVQETLLVLFRVLAIGVGVVITQTLGGPQPQQARRTARIGLGASTWAGLVVAAWMLAAPELTLRWLNAPPDVATLAAPFMRWLALALMLEAYNLTMASILRAHLHARDTLMVMVLMHSTHLVLALVLMRWLGLPGYALGFMVSRALGLGVHLWLWRRRLDLVPERGDWWKLPMRALGPVLRIGLPGASIEWIYRMAFMTALATAASLGVAALATQAYTLQILKFVLLLSMAIGWAVEILVGRLVGSGEFRNAHALVRKSVRNGLIASGTLVLVAAALAPWILRIFTRDPEIIRSAQLLLWMSFALETGRVFNLIVNGALRSTGDSIYPAVVSAVSIILVLGVGSGVLGRLYGLPGLWIAYAADEWLRGALIYLRWERHGWVQHARATLHRLRSPHGDSMF